MRNEPHFHKLDLIHIQQTHVAVFDDQENLGRIEAVVKLRNHREQRVSSSLDMPFGLCPIVVPAAIAANST